MYAGLLIYYTSLLTSTTYILFKISARDTFKNRSHLFICMHLNRRNTYDVHSEQISLSRYYSIADFKM